MSDSSPGPGAPNILLIEDNPGDVRLIEEGCENADVDVHLHATTDGTEALDFLYQRGEYADAPHPDLVVLDWHLPGKSSEKVLEEIKTESDLASIPVIVYSGSSSEQAVEKAYSLHANACISKPDGPDELIDKIHAVRDFWLDTADLPPHSEDGEDDARE